WLVIFFQAEGGIRDRNVTGVQTCALPIFGLTAGHEYVGEVVEVGSGVKGFQIGDLVSGEGHITCGKCRNCLEGHKENCKDAKGEIGRASCRERGEGSECTVKSKCRRGGAV